MAASRAWEKIFARYFQLSLKNKRGSRVPASVGLPGSPQEAILAAGRYVEYVLDL